MRGFGKLEKKIIKKAQKMEEIRWMPHKYMTKNMWIYHHLKYFGDGTNIGLFHYLEDQKL